jgi:ABC-type branched-subunit amino acid transport system substrate-binding protein
MIKKFYIPLVIVMVVAFMVLGFGCRGPAGEEEVEPIVIGYVGAVNSPGTKPAMDIVEMAVEEINAAGGILGRPVEYKIEDGKGETSLSVEAATRMVMGHKALAYMVEGRSEISLACMEKSAMLYPEYPHLFISNGAVAVEITEPCVFNYDKYKFVFRDHNPEPGHFAMVTPEIEAMRDLMGVKKLAILYEDLAWTTVFRKGYAAYGERPAMTTLKEMAEEDFGLQVVYEETVKSRTGMYLPILEAIAGSGVDGILFVDSWFTDVEVFAKQWPESSAKDIPVFLYGGVAETHDFWEMSGGKCLGICAAFDEAEIARTPETIPFLRKARERGIPCQMNVHFAYNTMYFLKQVIEKVGNTEDFDALIKAMETESMIGTMDIKEYENEKIPPFFHSRRCVDPRNPKKFIDLRHADINTLAQFQVDGKITVLWPPEFAHPEECKTPVQLRKEAGWPGY